MDGLIQFFVSLVIFCIVVGLLWWAMNFAFASFPPPAPLANGARVLFVLIAVLFAVSYLLGYVPGPRWRF